MLLLISDVHSVLIYPFHMTDFAVTAPYEIPGAFTVSSPTLAAILSESFPPSTAIPSSPITSHMALHASSSAAPSPGNLAGHIQLPLHFTSWNKKNRCLWNTNAPLPQHIKNRLDLWPTDLNLIGVIYSLRIIYVPSLKLLGQSVSELSVAQGVGEGHDLWPWTTDHNINRNHLLIKDYPPTKFECSRAKPSWVISCTRLRETDIPTDRETDMFKAICPSFFEGGHKYD